MGDSPLAAGIWECRFPVTQAYQTLKARIPWMLDPANISISETLRDGRKVEIRSQRPSDRKAFEHALARMSDESIQRRFFAARRHFSEKEAKHFLDIDFLSHVALVAVIDESGEQAIVGAGRYIVVQPGQAEVAFGVIDQYQGQGLGSALMRELAAVAREARVSELIAEVLSSNSAMLKVFEKSGLKKTTKREGQVIHVALKFA
jgi:RimJ/RimL family protein N-acetyltransferase